MAERDRSCRADNRNVINAQSPLSHSHNGDMARTNQEKDAGDGGMGAGLGGVVGICARDLFHSV